MGLPRHRRRRNKSRNHDPESLYACRNRSESVSHHEGVVYPQQDIHSGGLAVCNASEKTKSPEKGTDAAGFFSSGKRKYQHSDEGPH